MRFVATVSLAVSLLAGSACADVILYEDRVKLSLYSKQNLSKAQRRGLQKFKQKRVYFGAFYVSPGHHLFTWNRGFHTYQAVLKVTKAQCDTRAQAVGAPECVLYMGMVPRSLSGNRSDENGVSQKLAQYLKNKNLRVGKPGQYRAVARNGLQHFGMAPNKDTEQEAREWAVRICEMSAERAFQGQMSEVEAMANRAGLLGCRVVRVERQD